MTELDHYDAIVIGAGQAGGPLSTALAGSGRRTALIEALYVGGSCINYGCAPTKTMVASARVAYLARRAAEYGVRIGSVSVDMARVRERKQAIVESWRNGSQRRIEGTEGVDLIFGEGRFVGPKTIGIQLKDGGVRTIDAQSIFINAGARPERPPIPGLDSIPALDSTSIMELDTVPEHLVVLGGGYVGLEFGQMFRRFGSEVTIVQRASRLAEREDPDVAEELAKILREDGIEILLQAQTQRVEPGQNGSVRVFLRTFEGERTVEGSRLLVSTGRVSNTDRLNLEAAGIETEERGLIKVNERLETNVPGVYALGDSKPGPWFTHISYDDFRIIRTNLIEGGDASTDGRMVPYTIFTDPQLGRIGLTETEARAQGRNIRVAKMPMAWVARALETDEPRGLMKAVVAADTDQILGAAILGLEGGELMAMLQIAMMGRVPWTTLRNAIFAHPTLAESLNNLFGNWQQ
ncbi:MAG: mercuric reductase [Chloroflexi bacterium]|nr:mercuric reductase [Chloroflexota bacterium]